MIIDLYRDVREPRRMLAVTSGDWPRDVVPAGVSHVQLFDYLLVERAVEVETLAGRSDLPRLRAELGDQGYAFYTALEVVFEGEAAATPEAEAEALLRRAGMLMQAAQSLRSEAAGLGRDWLEDVEGLAAALRLERMTEGLADRAQRFPVCDAWLSEAEAA